MPVFADIKWGRPQKLMKSRLFLASLALGVATLSGRAGSAQDFPHLVFDRYLAPLAQQIGMPGLSAVILRNNRIEWYRGYGYANVESRIPSDPVNTPYVIGGVTQAITGVLAGICVDRHQLHVDDDIRGVAPAFAMSTSIRNVLSHATAGHFRYDPATFAALMTPVIEKCHGRPYRVAAAVEVLDRLGMRRSVPGLDFNRPEGAAARTLFDARMQGIYDAVLADVAVPYRIDRGRYSRTEYPAHGLDPAGGLVATAFDLAEFERQLDDDDNIPFNRSTLLEMWTPTIIPAADNSTSTTTPTGLGWFVQRASGQRLVWTFGHIPQAASALILKLPEKNLTLILLSNSDGLTAGYNFEAGDVTTSPFVKVFLRLFI